MLIAQRLCVGGPLDGRIVSSAPENVMLQHDDWDGWYVLSRLSPNVLVYKFQLRRARQPTNDHFAKRKRTINFAKTLTPATF